MSDARSPPGLLPPGYSPLTSHLLNDTFLVPSKSRCVKMRFSSSEPLWSAGSCCNYIGLHIQESGPKLVKVWGGVCSVAGTWDWRGSIDWIKPNWVHFDSNYGANKLSNSSCPLENRQNLSLSLIQILLADEPERISQFRECVWVCVCS